MNIKTVLCATLLSISATLQCMNREQLKAELAVKEEQLRELDKRIKNQEERFLFARKRVTELYNLFIQTRKSDFLKANPKKNISDAELHSMYVNESHRFIDAFCCNGKEQVQTLNEEFFGDFEQHFLLKFYIIKYTEEHKLLRRTIAEWEVCTKEKDAIRYQLAE